MAVLLCELKWWVTQEQIKWKKKLIIEWGHNLQWSFKIREKFKASLISSVGEESLSDGDSCVCPGSVLGCVNSCSNPGLFGEGDMETSGTFCSGEGHLHTQTDLQAFVTEVMIYFLLSIFRRDWWTSKDRSACASGGGGMVKLNYVKSLWDRNLPTVALVDFVA